MFRLILPAIILGLPATAQDTGVCQISPDNCVQVLACVGDQGVVFEGRARGWDQGTVSGNMSDTSSCTGTWTSDGR